MTRQTVEEYIAAGGTVTRCKAYERMTFDDVARIVLSAPETVIKREPNGRRQRPPQPKQEKVKVAVCWLCDRRLWAGGTSHTTIVEDGHEHPAHKFCAKQALKAENRELIQRGITSALTEPLVDFDSIIDPQDSVDDVG